VSRYGDVVFVGEVLSRRDVSSGYGVVYQVRIIETFRGTGKAGEIVSLRTGFGGGDCGYHFKISARYLIDASKHDDTFHTDICHINAPVEETELELNALRSIAAGQRPPDFFGVLLHRVETEDGGSVEPLPGFPVTAKPSAGGSTQKTLTDASGSFTFARLPEGKYELMVGLPSGWSVASPHFEGPFGEDRPLSIWIQSSDGKGSACHMVIVAQSLGSISGVVQPGASDPIDGWVIAHAVGPDDQPTNLVVTVTPGPDGKFSLGRMRAGRYSVAFTNRAGFVPGKRQIIELREGEDRTGVTLLPQ
jgi:hypothetical protein